MTVSVPRVIFLTLTLLHLYAAYITNDHYFPCTCQCRMVSTLNVYNNQPSTVSTQHQDFQ